MSTPSRETDDQAIEALCFLLDHAEFSGLASRSGLEGTRGELWSDILRRRFLNGYETKQPSVASLRAQWMYRHYHVRLLAYPDEGPKRSAAHVAAKWKGNENSVRTNATGTGAQDWIKEMAERWQRPFQFDGGVCMLMDYKALEATITQLSSDFTD